ncbi:MAG TPA: metallophosphoesterase family protein, partial [Chryseosolibacter sp.]|nr:metallophosphoesterase family protein [Chryseosolibacter sp.]
MAFAAFGITPIQGAGKAEKSLSEKSQKIRFPSHERIARAVFIADTHAVDDAKDRDLQWNVNSFGRIKQLLAQENVRPTHLLWLGDVIDFLPSEWEIAKSWVGWIIRNHAAVKQYALMGNHDYIYYNYPEIQGKFYSFMPEVESFLRSPAKEGDTRLFVEDAKQFIGGQQILLIETPDRNASNRSHIGVVKHIDPKRNSIQLVEPLTVSFAASSTAVRQGYTEARGIASFLSTFAGTETRSTNSIFFVGNTCFLLLSMNNFFSFDPHTLKTRGISEDDFHWFEEQLANYHQTHNIIVATHEMPNSGKSLGNLHDPNDAVDFDETTRKRLTELARKYEISAWVSGHTHPNARTDVVHSTQAATHFLLVPSLGMNPEGQVLMVELREGAKSLDFKYW